MNIKTASVEFAAGAARAAGFLAEPAETGPLPALIVLQEFWGLNDHIKDVTGRFAKEGFVALAPDMYDGKVTSDPNEARQLLMSLDQVAALAKLQGAVEYLKKNKNVVENRIGVVGFCMGGYLALNLACNNKDIRATAAFYGRIPPNTTLDNLNAPVLYVFGGQDHHLPAADVNRLEEFFRSSGKPGKVVRYPEADHAFMNDTRKEVYRANDARDAWGKALEFLRGNLG
jgi:carboxymethylenebutenolidase